MLGARRFVVIRVPVVWTPELLMLPPLISKVVGARAFRMTDATTLLVTVSVVPSNVKLVCACAAFAEVPVAVSTRFALGLRIDVNPGPVGPVLPVGPVTVLAGPVGPVFPVGPVTVEAGPVGPVLPVGPVTVEAGPVGPVLPVGPVTVEAAPVGPVLPVGPVTVLAGPVGPVFPVGPVTVLAGPVGPVLPVGPVTVLAGPVGPVLPVNPGPYAMSSALKNVDTSLFRDTPELARNLKISPSVVPLK